MKAPAASVCPVVQNLIVRDRTTIMAATVKANPTTDSSILKLNVIVVGAGIGGMAAATALGRRGHNVTVFEDAPQIGEVAPRQIQLSDAGNRLAQGSKCPQICPG